MRLSELLGMRVVDAGNHRVGTITDVRLAIAGELQDNPATPRVLGLVISPRTDSSFLGYERTTATAPFVLARLLRWRHRGTFLAAWEDVARVGQDSVRLRPRFTRYSAVLSDGPV
ncbi:MAG TPA: PRC-barrel domain-containing protein [Mycobacterium sp.]|nr:PRC-barrel domain-containing protein [Mycobacterium sp.]